MRNPYFNRCLSVKNFFKGPFLFLISLKEKVNNPNGGFVWTLQVRLFEIQR
jgi:hypothetical protein